MRNENNLILNNTGQFRVSDMNMDYDLAFARFVVGSVMRIMKVASNHGWKAVWDGLEVEMTDDVGEAQRLMDSVNHGNRVIIDGTRFTCSLHGSVSVDTLRMMGEIMAMAETLNREIFDDDGEAIHL